MWVTVLVSMRLDAVCGETCVVGGGLIHGVVGLEDGDLIIIVMVFVRAVDVVGVRSCCT